MTWRTGWIGKCESWPTDSHKNFQRRLVTWYPTASTSTMSVDSVSKTSSWHDVTWHVEPRWNNRYLVWCEKKNVTLHGYRIPPSILKQTVGVLEIRPKQDHYVWFPPKRPGTTAHKFLVPRDLNLSTTGFRSSPKNTIFRWIPSSVQKQKPKS